MYVALRMDEFFLGLIHAFEPETCDNRLHHGLDLRVAKIAYTALVGVIDCLVGLELSGLNLQSNLLVSISEGDACHYAAVYLFNAKHQRISLVVEDMLVHLQLSQHMGGHTQAIFQLVESGEEQFLDYLQISKIARWEVVADERDLLG